jgi:hypothetical protein
MIKATEIVAAFKIRSKVIGFNARGANLKKSANFSKSANFIKRRKKEGKKENLTFAFLMLIVNNFDHLF